MFYDDCGSHNDDYVYWANVYITCDNKKVLAWHLESQKQNGGDDWYWCYIYADDGLCNITGMHQDGKSLDDVKVYPGEEKHKSPFSQTGGKANCSVTWYFPPKYAGKAVSFSVEWDPKYGDKHSKALGSVTVKETTIPTINGASLSKNPGKVDVSYNTGSVAPIKISHPGTNDCFIESTDKTGTFQLPISESAQQFTVRMQYQYNTDYADTSESSVYKILPYHLPKSFKAEDAVGANTMLTWTMDTTGGDMQTDDYFTVERSTDPEFGSETSVGTIEYDKSKTEYSLLDQIGETNPNGTYYYRIRRNSMSGWGWDICSKTSIEKETSHVFVNSATVERCDWNSSVQKAKISWELEAESGHKVWNSNAELIIKRTMNTGSSLTTNEISVPVDSLKAGHYVDDLPQTCVKYEYALYVKPNNNNFKTQNELNAEVVGDAIYPSVMSTPTSIVASKGYYTNYVSIQWATDGTDLDHFNINRRELGSTDWLIIDQLGSGTQTSYVYNDDKAVPGVIYEYRVAAVHSCAGEVTTRYTDVSRGFSSATGVISGKVTFENGDAEQDVKVRLSGVDISAGNSLLFKGNGNVKSVAIEMPEAYSVEAWVRPSEASQTASLIAFGDYKLAIEAGKAVFSVNDSKVTLDEALSTSEFTHLTAVYDGNSIALYKDTSVVVKAAVATPVTLQETAVRLGEGFKGHIDEVSLWNKALAKSDVENTFNRYLVGNEVGLMAYWRFNEGVSDEFYDLSYHSATYNANHGTIRNAEISGEIPTFDQLSFLGYTGSDGIYNITGVPYEGNGSTYTLVPSFPNHSFSPSSSTVTIGASASAISGKDFIDNSAIVIDGYVFYENSSIPVKDVMFKINGVTATNNEGDIIMTNAKGYFEFSVPVGQQKVQAVLNNHTFKFDGLLVDSRGENLNYQQPRSNLRFWDQTKVKLLGRVTGGTRESSKELGHSLSKNNLGDNLKIVMSLEGDATSEIYDTDAIYDENGEHVDAEDAPANSDSLQIHHDGKHSNAVVYNQYDIQVTPDVETGEYEAWLYPVKYKVEEVSIQGWGNLLNASEVVDMSNVFTAQQSVYIDSVFTPQGELEKVIEDSVMYNETYSCTKRVRPTLSYKQGNSGGKNLDYFGMKDYVFETMEAQKDTVLLYSNGVYTFGVSEEHPNGLPIFKVGKWGFNVYATEDYAYNNDYTSADAQIDQVPTQSAPLTINNGFAAQSAPQTATLDDEGHAYVEVSMTSPYFATNDLAHLDFAVTINNETITADPLYAYLIGSDQNDGKDFVTGGPIRLLNILRDPPGSHSYSWWESGQTFSYSSMSSHGFVNAGTETETIKLGVTKTMGLGSFASGVVDFQETDMDNDIRAGIEHEENTNNPETNSFSVTLNSRFQTSDDPLNVGSAADVFVGYANNIFYGPIREIGVLDQSSYDASTQTDKEKFLEATQNGKTYYLCNMTNLGVSSSLSTLFAYTQSHIENILLPNLVKMRDALLLKKEKFTEADAQRLADANDCVTYLSLLAEDDPHFGENNSKTLQSYKTFIPSTGLKAKTVECKVLNEVVTAKDGTPDSVYFYNNSISEWKRVLKQNEDEKLAAIQAKDYVDSNRSFTAASPVEYSEEYSVAREESYEYEFMTSAIVAGECGFTFNGVGFATSVEETFGGTGEYSQTSSAEKTAAAGYTLADEGDFDYLSVDVLRAAPVDQSFLDYYNEISGKLNDNYTEKDDEEEEMMEKMSQYGSFVFYLRGGATACPYEPQEYTKYQDGKQQLLGDGSLQIENPSILVDKPVISGVPSDQPAVFNLKLMNDSKVRDATAIFQLAMVDASNQHGAKFSIDGVPLSDGRAIEVPYGEVLNKVLEIERGTEYDYENLALVLRSECQSDPTDFQADVADTVYLAAHFVPTSSDISIASPTDKWTMNTNSSYDDASGKYYIPVTVSGYDVNFTGFHHIEIQYKPTSSSDVDWTKLGSYYADQTLYNEASGTKGMIEGSEITTQFFGAEDQNYDIRALTYCQVGNDFVTKTSAVLTGIKDTKRPVVFGNIQPADGVLDVEDEIRLTFNEPIAEGYMTEVKNFQITGVRNGSVGDHSVSINFNGTTDNLFTQAPRNLTDKDLTVEMWILPAATDKDMTLLSHGTETKSLDFGITADKCLQVSFNGQTYTSTPVALKTTDWAHVAFTLSAADHRLRAYFGGEIVLDEIATDSYAETGTFTIGKSKTAETAFAGKMHELRIWNKVVAQADLIANNMRIYSGKEANMLAYYPMTEGKGSQVTDKARSATAVIDGASWSTLEGMSLAFDGNTVVVVNSSEMAITPTMDYTLQFWFSAEEGTKNAMLLSNLAESDKTPEVLANKVEIGFNENGKLFFRNSGYEQIIQKVCNDGTWHNFTIAVNRNAGNAQVFIDGQLDSYFDATKLGGMAATTINLGKGYKGNIDELTLWNMALPSTRVANNYNVTPNGTEMGLVAYLPFSRYIINSANTQEMVYSNRNLVTDMAVVTGGDAISTTDKAPVVAVGPEVFIPFTYVVNNDALVINLMDTPEAIEKTTINFTVKDVSDMNGNILESPVTWSAYINQNQLKWDIEDLTMEKGLYEPLTFTVDIRNNGGKTKDFVIEGLPSWLTATPAEGTLGALSKATIEFTVDEGVNVGSYDETIYLTGENNVSEPLPFSLKVVGDVPQWDVNPADYKYSMNINGRLRIEDIYSNDEEDIIAAFQDGKCVGRAVNSYQSDNDMWYTFITVYGNEAVANKSLTFKIWDASTGTTYHARPSQTITFKAEDMVGSIAEPVIFEGKEEKVQNIALSKGWNWISVYVQTDELKDINSLLAGCNWTTDDQVKNDELMTFADYIDGFGWITDDANKSFEFNNTNMFLVYSSVAQTLGVTGIPVTSEADRTLSLHSGWNRISYLPQVNLTVNEALSGYEATYGDIIKGAEGFAQYADNLGWMGSLKYMKPGQGYMLYRTTDAASTLTYPVVYGNNSVAANVQNKAVNYNATMSIVAEVDDETSVEQGDVLKAYVGGELRGSVEISDAKQSPLFFLSVEGDKNAPVAFKLVRDGDVVAESNEVMMYSANAIKGTVATPVVIDFSNAVNISVGPNPFVDALYFNMNTNAGDKVTIDVYDIRGLKMYMHSDIAESTSYSHVWKCSGIAEGIYLIKVNINGREHTYKCIKK